MPLVVLYCPVCERTKGAASEARALVLVKDHVTKNHPEYPSDWADDYIVKGK